MNEQQKRIFNQIFRCMLVLGMFYSISINNCKNILIIAVISFDLIFDIIDDIKSKSEEYIYIDICMLISWIIALLMCHSW